MGYKLAGIALIIALIYYLVFEVVIPLFSKNTKTEVTKRHTVRLVKLDKIMKESESIKNRKEEIRGETEKTQEILSKIKNNLK